jgi:putative oxidoreductase
MLKAITQTTNTFAPTILRLALGAVMLPHGCQKALGLWGGSGWTKTMSMFHSMHIPTVLAAAVIITEFAGSICLILGLLTRVWSLGFIILMTTAIVKVHSKNGFFMNWMGNQKGEGFEYHLLVIGIALALLILGAGKLSLDAGLGGGGAKASKAPKPSKPKKDE